MTATKQASGSAERWGPLWGALPEDWAANEERQVPTYEEAMRRVEIEPGQRVLDLGCGSGVFLRLAADRGARPFGIDASETLIAIARDRVPEAGLRVGDIQFLPYGDDEFDLVTGFNSFFFAADLVAALREARRVAKPGAPVVIQVWGPPERNDLEAVKVVMRQLLPPRPPDAPPEPRLWAPGVLEEMARRAALTPESSFDLRYEVAYGDEGTLGRLMLAPAGIGTLVSAEQRPQVQREMVEALAGCRQPDGSYRLENGFHYLIARA
jgi:SAM-dependent methyltransferase